MTTAVAMDIGARLSDQLAESLGRARYERWFGDVQLDLNDAGLTVVAPNRFAADFIAKHYQSAMQRVLTEEIGRPLPITFQAPDASPRTTPAAPALPARPAPAPARSLRQPQSRYALEDLVVGDFNHMALSMARRLVDQADDPINLLVLHGGCGVGKTHLLQGLCQRFNTAAPAKRWRYLTAEQFTNDYITAVRSGKLAAFRQSLRRLDLLALDDIQFLANKTGTQTEFLHTFDALQLRGARLALAADVHPKLLGDFSDQLVSRFVGGMVSPIQSPDHATRIRLLQTLGHRRGLAFHEQILPVLADRCGQSVRDIQGQLNLIELLAEDEAHMQQVNGHRLIGHAIVDRLLGASRSMRPARPVRFAAILEQVCDHLQVDRAAVLTSSKQRLIVLARSLAAFLARQLTPMSFNEIASALKRPNHTTIITACQRVQQQLDAGHAVLLPARQQHLPLKSILEDLHRRIAAVSV